MIRGVHAIHISPRAEAARAVLLRPAPVHRRAGSRALDAAPSAAGAHTNGRHDG